MSGRAYPAGPSGLAGSAAFVRPLFLYDLRLLSVTHAKKLRRCSDTPTPTRVLTTALEPRWGPQALMT